MENKNHIVILVGVCGTGKSTVGQKVAQRLGIPFFDADKLPASQDVSLEKWLISIEGLIMNQSTEKGCVISCSILKKEHRKRLTANVDHELDWVFMNDSYENAAQRIEKAEVHDRRFTLLKSDFENLEIPKRALTIDMTYSEQEIVDTILKYMARKYG